MTRAILLAALLCSYAASQESAQVLVKVEFQGKPDKTFNQEKMENVYYATCFQVASEIWPGIGKDAQAKRLRPQVLLVIGDEKDYYERDSNLGYSIIHLKKWNVQYFAEGMALAALDSAVPWEKLAFLARQAVVSTEAMISIKDLQ